MPKRITPAIWEKPILPVEISGAELVPVNKNQDYSKIKLHVTKDDQSIVKADIYTSRNDHHYKASTSKGTNAG